MSFQKNIAAGLLLVLMIPHYTTAPTKWLILKACTVTVNGSTNINKFTCIIPDYGNHDTLTCFRSNRSTAVSMTGQLIVPVAGFNCASTIMTRDLRKTLQSIAFPSLFIQFVSLQRYPALKLQEEHIAGRVIIELAGVKKQLEVNYTISMDEMGVVSLKGTQSILFTDFNLIAPRKLGGMIRTNNQLDVVFVIHCKIINP
ncbi:MAG: YceI family protein [Bacteroidota bacterium]